MSLLIDSRRGIGKADQEIMRLLDDTAVSWAAVLTKADKLKSAELAKVCKATETTIATHVAAFPELFVTSSERGDGLAHLRGHLAMFAEN